MSRPLRKKIKFDEESVNCLLQEIYDESFNIKAKIARLFSKWELKVKEGGEIAAIGDQIIKLIGAESKNQDQKIVLLRYLKEVVFENGKSHKDDEDSGSKEISSEKRSELIALVKAELENKKS